jgi:hypothetical protein
MSADLLIPAAALGPAAAATAWLAASPLRWLRRLIGGALALSSAAAAWGVFWLAYSGEAPGWSGLSPSLLTASVAAFVATACLPAAVRADGLAPRESAPAVVGLGVGAAAAIVTVFSESLVSVAVLLPVPTLAAGAAAWSGAGSADARGLVGAAAADVLGLVGLVWLLGETGSTLTTPAGMAPGALMVLGVAAVKLGAVPWLGTWRLAASDGAAAPVTLALRGQGAALLVVVGVVMGGGEVTPVLVWGAGGAALASGAATLWRREPGAAAAAVAGVGASVPFLATGLGGTVGTRAVLLLLPPFLLAVGATVLLLERRPGLEEDGARWERWLGGAAIVIAAASLLALPPFGGFPGTWLALSLAWARSEAFPYLPAMAGVALGIGLGAVGAVGLPRGLRPRRVAMVSGTAVAAALVYMGAQPVRLAAGWLVRLEAELGLPEILPTAGAPSLPPSTGWDLLWAGLPGLVLVVAILVAGRGLRDADRPFDGLLSVRRLRVPVWARPAARRSRRLARRGRAIGERAREAQAGLWAFVVVEAVALAVVVWVVWRGATMGFL